MNLRPLYTIITSFIIAILIIVGLYFYSSSNIEEDENSTSNLHNTTIQLLPKPIILTHHSKTSLKSNELENLLISKSDNILSISDTDIDFSNIISVFPFSLKKISMHFRYNKEEDRIDFDGQSNRRYQSLEISGYYKHTKYNQIHYVINISNDINELNINALYTPSTKETSSDSVTGQFILKTNSSMLLKHSSNKDDMSITGNFYKTDNVLKLEKVSLSSNILNLSADTEITNNNMISNIIISDTNLDNLKQNINIYGLYNDLFEHFPQIAKNKSSTFINFKKASYGPVKIEDGLLKFTTNENKISITKFDLTTSENIKISSTGNIIHTPFSLEYIGNLNITDLSTDTANNFIQLDSDSLDKEKDIEITSKIRISPPLLHLTDLKITQGFTEVGADFKYHNYLSNKIIRINSEIKNYKQPHKSLSFIDLILRKFNHVPQINANTDKKLPDFTHAKLSFNNLHTSDNININNVSAVYVDTPLELQIRNISTKSPNLNIDGEIAFNFKKDPKASILFKGYNSDTYVLYNLISKSMLNCSQIKDCKPFLQNVTKLNGRIAFDIEGTPNSTTPLSSLNCSSQIDTNLNIKQCTATLFEGKLVMNGNIHIDDKIKYSINYDLEEADAQSLIKRFLTKQIKTEGYFNTIKGFITSYGADGESFIKNLSGNFNIKANHINIERLDLQKLVNKYTGKIQPQSKVIHNRKMLPPRRNDSNWFDIRNLDAKFTIANSEIKSSHFFFDTNNNIKSSLSIKYGIPSDYLTSIMKLSYIDPIGRRDYLDLNINGTINDLQLRTSLYSE